MTEQNAVTTTNETVAEPIARAIGERCIVTNGRDYLAPSARVVSNTHAEALDHEKALYISQGDKAGISISLPTLEAIINWAKQQSK